MKGFGASKEGCGRNQTAGEIKDKFCSLLLMQIAASRSSLSVNY